MPGACEFLLNRVVHLRSLHGRSTTRRANGLPSSPAATVARVPARRIALALLAIPLAGCGNPVHSHYSVKQTAPCLRKLGYKVSTNAEKPAASAQESAERRAAMATSAAAMAAVTAAAEPPPGAGPRSPSSSSQP